MDYIEIKGAREHNLKSISVEIPRNNFILVSGVSGSGKSSLVQNVIAREGQRQYLSQLNSKARQHFGKLGKAEVDEIKGMSPVVSLDQVSFSNNIRSTVGTLSELYDYFRLLFARYSNSPGKIDNRLSRSSFSFNQAEGACPSCKGLGVEEYIEPDTFIKNPEKSVLDGALSLTNPSGYVIYSQVTLDVLQKVCESEGFDLSKAWEELDDREKNVILYGSNKIKIPFGKHPLESRMKWSGITAKPREEGHYRGMIPIMEEILKRDRNKNILKYAHSRNCPTCRGKRLKQDSLAYLWQGKDIAEWSSLPIGEINSLMQALINAGKTAGGESQIVKSIIERSSTINSLGIGYLTLERNSTSLSSGEIKRLRLSTLIQNIISGLVYTLDEPTIGLHPRDHENLLSLMRQICDLGNTMIVIDHKNIAFDFADFWIELGPQAGYKGGQIIFAGRKSDLIHKHDFLNSVSWSYLSGKSRITRELTKLKKPEYLIINNTDVNNLKAESVKFLINGLNLICGVSGAGKSSLLSGTLLPLLSGERLPGSKSYLQYQGKIHKVIKIDQKPIGRNSRSNPATYTKLFDRIRDIYGKLPEVKGKGWDKSRFSFNTDGGRCPECQGAGFSEIGLSYLGNVEITCDTCRGKRFTNETLEIKYKGKSILEVLEMEVDEALDFFRDDKSVAPYLEWLSNLGLGYIKLGQPSTTLSGGEAQRIKLATELVRPPKGHTVYLLDEPASGLHAADIQILLNSLQQLLKKGHTIIIVEHDPDLVKVADWIVELGPESGEKGGDLIFTGTANELLKESTPMAAALKKNDKRRSNAAAILKESHPRAINRDRQIELQGVRTNNLKDINLKIKAGQITAITGVSGSGKTSLVYDTLYRSAQFYFSQTYSTYVRSIIGGDKPGDFNSAKGLLPSLAIRQYASQKSPRSTMATISGIFPILRLVFSRFARDSNGRSSGLLAREFSFNDKSGACLKCEGLGSIMLPDPDKIFLNPDLSIYEGACYGTKVGKYFTDPSGQFMAILKSVEKESGRDFSLPFKTLSNSDKEIILEGTADIKYNVIWNYQRKNLTGTHSFEAEWKGLLNLIEEEYYKRAGSTRQAAIEKAMTRSVCPNCNGRRLRNQLLKYKLDGSHIADWLEMTVDQFISRINDFKKNFGSESLLEEEKYFIDNAFEGITKVLKIVSRLGMAYMQMNRSVNSLSSGEFQRVRIAAQLGSELVGLMYLIDEPSASLHPSNLEDLWKVFREICSRGNTIIMVDHNPIFYNHADEIIELGPGGGDEGGEIINHYKNKHISDAEIHKGIQLTIQKGRKGFNPNITLGSFKNLKKNNLQIDELTIPKGWTSIIGVSGSGKSTLLSLIVEEMQSEKYGTQLFVPSQEISNWLWHQNPLKGLRIYELAMKEFCQAIDEERKKPKPDYFLLTRKGGRCEVCEGKGEKTISLDFLGHSNTSCEECNGTGYSSEARTFSSNGMSIDQFLSTSLGDIYKSGKWPAINKELEICNRMGLGYLKAGQKGNSLSFGEKQRLLLVKELSQTKKGESLIIFDEPSRGLHQKDSMKFVAIINELVENGHSVIMIEHKPEIIYQSDWLIELGPEGGEKGGKIIFEGTPRSFINNSNTPTSRVISRLSSPE